MTHATVATPTRVPTAAEMAAYSFLARYSRNTLATYSVDLKVFYQWCETQGLDPLADVKRPHLELFGRYLETERGNAPSSVARRLILLKCFYRIAAADDYITKSPAEHVRIPHAYRDESRLVHLDRSDLSAMLMTARLSTPSDSALIVLMGLLGLRVSEACSIDVADTLHIERGHRVVKVLGKGLKRRECPLPIFAIRELDRAIGDRDDGPLLLRRDGTRMTRESARRVVERIARRAGITKHVYPHALRAAYVTNMLDAGVAIRDVQIGAGHSDPRVTMRYDRARNNLDRSGNYVLASYLAGSS